MDEIEKAVKEANAYDFIMKLPHVSCAWALSRQAQRVELWLMRFMGTQEPSLR
jgi:ABC-type multidrug transport system fused ATPase/permease subunit